MREAYRITIHVLCKLRTEYPVAFTHEYEKTPCPLGLKLLHVKINCLGWFDDLIRTNLA